MADGIDPRYAALLDGLLYGRLDRRAALKRASALGLGAVAASGLPFGLGAAPQAAAQEGGGELIVGASQEAVNFNPLLYANTGPETLPEVLMFDSLMKITPEGEYVPNLATEVPTRENGGVS
jgi:peptide/nickel transport system substrate-binding protein